MAVLSLCKAFSRCFFIICKGDQQRSGFQSQKWSRDPTWPYWPCCRGWMSTLRGYGWGCCLECRVDDEKNILYVIQLYINVCLQGAIRNICILYTYVAYIAINLVKYSDLHSNNVWTAAGETASVVCFVDSCQILPHWPRSHPATSDKFITFCSHFLLLKFLRWWSFIMGSERFLSGALWNSCKASPFCNIQNRSNFIKHDCLTA